MNNNEPTPVQIAQTISIMADTVIRLSDKNLLEPSNVIAANAVLAKLIAKADEAVEKCLTVDCGDNTSPNDGEQINYVDQAWQNLGQNLNFTEDFCNNLSLLAGMDANGLGGTVKEVLYIQDMNPSNGSVSGAYEAIWNGLNQQAQDSGNAYQFFLDYLTNLTSSMMGQDPSDCQ